MLDRLDRLLTWRRARTYALVLVLLYVVAWVDVLVLGDPPLNSGGVPIAGDYIAFHAAARLVLTGHAAQLYDHDTIVRVQDSLLRGRIPGFYDAFRNPPFYALIYAPLGALDLLPAFAVWSLLSLGCLGLSIRLLADEVPWVRSRWRGVLVLVFAFSPVYFGLIDGENALVSLLLFVLLYRALARRQDCLAGVWAALGLFKPQLFFIFPLVFVVSRRWRALAAYVLVAAALFAVSLALVGTDGALAWGRIILEPEGGNATVNGWRMASAKSFFDALLPGQSIVALVLYLAVSLVSLVTVARTWAGRGVTLPAAWVLTSLAAVLIDPHLVDYDLTVLVAAGVVGAAFVRQLRWPIVLLYLLALFRAQIPIGDVSVQLTALLLAWCTVSVNRQIRKKVSTDTPVWSTSSDAALVTPR